MGKLYWFRTVKNSLIFGFLNHPPNINFVDQLLPREQSVNETAKVEEF